MHKEQFTWVISNIFAVYMLLVNFRYFFEHVITSIRKPPENGLCLEMFLVYLADYETKITFSIKKPHGKISLER